ncbi:MAG: ribosome recycling factor [Elusimicrobiota bacterium]|nr:ribosome recycling factor [Elusimicrobiota bacterium]
MPYKEIEKKCKEKMDKVVETARQELRGIRTGRASAAILEGIRADYYGSQTPLNQLANINIPQPRLIEIKVWDQNAVSAVEKAIIAANIGLTPSTEGNIIRLQIPTLTSERRQQLVKRISDIVENFRVEIRNIRRDANKVIQQLAKDGKISEDQEYRSLENIQKITDTHIENIDKIAAAKEKEIKEG